MFYNHLIFSMVTLSLRILLKYCVSLYGNFSFKALKLTKVKLDSDEDLQGKYEKCNTNSMRNAFLISDSSPNLVVI